MGLVRWGLRGRHQGVWILVYACMLFSLLFFCVSLECFQVHVRSIVESFKVLWNKSFHTTEFRCCDHYYLEQYILDWVSLPDIHVLSILLCRNTKII